MTIIRDALETEAVANLAIEIPAEGKRLAPDRVCEAWSLTSHCLITLTWEQRAERQVAAETSFLGGIAAAFGFEDSSSSAGGDSPGLARFTASCMCPWSVTYTEPTPESAPPSLDAAFGLLQSPAVAALPASAESWLDSGFPMELRVAGTDGRHIAMVRLAAIPRPGSSFSEAADSEAGASVSAPLRGVCGEVNSVSSRLPPAAASLDIVAVAEASTSGSLPAPGDAELLPGLAAVDSSLNEAAARSEAVVRQAEAVAATMAEGSPLSTTSTAAAWACDMTSTPVAQFRLALDGAAPGDWEEDGLRLRHALRLRLWPVGSDECVEWRMALPIGAAGPSGHAAVSGARDGILLFGVPGDR